MPKGTFAYIDHSNISRTLHVLGFNDLDWAALINWLKTRQKVTRVYLYAGYGSKTEKEKLLKLGKHGYIVDLKKVQTYPPEAKKHQGKCPKCKQGYTCNFTEQGRRKANCDAELTLDVIKDGVKDKYDGIMVFSGDGDFGRVYEYVTETLTKPVTVFAPMGEKAGKRTSTRIKSMHNKGIIKLNALEGILGYKGYGIK